MYDVDGNIVYTVVLSSKENTMEKNFLTHIKEFFANIKRDQVLALVAVICAIVCVILCAACLASVSKATKGIETVVQEVQEMKQASVQLTERITHLETVVDNTQTALNESTAAKYINITKQPSSVSTYVGRTDAMIFSVVATGTDLSFTWQKYDEASDKWNEVVFDGTGFNTDMGLRLYDDSSAGTSELWTKNLTESAFGTYRCVITDSQGTTVTSESVQLAERAQS